MAKIKSVYICSECGYESPKWYGKCPGCDSWNTLEENVFEEEKTVSSKNKERRVSKTEISSSKLSEIDEKMAFFLALPEYDKELFLNKKNKIADYVAENVDLRPAAIIDRFDLRRPIYRQLAAYGHMGREDLNAPWEKTDLAEVLKAELL